MSKGSASSPTEASPLVRRSTIARRVESARAPKVAPRGLAKARRIVHRMVKQRNGHDERAAAEGAAEANGLPVLWHLKASHYNEKARLARDYKRIPHIRRALTPGSHAKAARKLGAGG